MGEGPPQGESSLPHAAPPLGPRVPEPSPLPPDTTPVSRPPDDAMEGWALVQGKRGKRKARAPLLSTDAEAPRKTRSGAPMPSPLPCPRVRSIPRYRLGKTWQHGRAVPFLHWSPFPPRPPIEPLLPCYHLDPCEPRGERCFGHWRGDLWGGGRRAPFCLREDRAPGSDPSLPGGGRPSASGPRSERPHPAPPSPCSLPLTTDSAPTSEGSLSSSICPAAGGTLLSAGEPTEAMAGAMGLGPEPHGMSLVGVGQPTSFPGGDPTEGCPPFDAVATTPAMEPEPSITEGPLPTPPDS
ncbi:hypothetical protein UY3_17056 [Chelonia mydas]|uniref:Uncharacterized protein n=1 Tax=Chelonia mydas TaxID=8469 RepID=M7AMY8_CHEMY|nr:hypothetical protein UY3_17056 [Chelonia mydas]